MTFKDWLHNLTEPEQLHVITCQRCAHTQPKAVGWDYQRCSGCGKYLFDYRGGIW